MSARLNNAQPYAVGLFRIVVGLLFACHGARSLFGVLGGGGETVSAGTWPGWYAAVIELVGGTLVLLGLGTRAASFIASGAMAYAYFDVHQPNALMPIQNQGELAAAFCWAFFLLVFTGSGAFGVDRLLTKRSSGASRSKESREKTPIAV
ncbi:DoxX family protein [Streptomyces sp. WI04-05B]|uniref:DoxX family protein n=1 Tax=Streptomyces TaxID=1883 RepID=UPI0029B35CB4|nr:MULTISPECIES: DoxX family protein [unclassified Streptomyces]MDX2540562.1 DoxX family protein [Streptomyces sp. WI04-05B]MDX2585006.1 DoxX family protein [Streptomyces sp. WI04-05A]MDX3749274.1 DoxX family protein [Streptomyces sp. AK08-02]